MDRLKGVSGDFSRASRGDNFKRFITKRKDKQKKTTTTTTN